MQITEECTNKNIKYKLWRFASNVFYCACILETKKCYIVSKKGTRYVEYQLFDFYTYCWNDGSWRRQWQDKAWGVLNSLIYNSVFDRCGQYPLHQFASPILFYGWRRRQCESLMTGRSSITTASEHQFLKDLKITETLRLTCIPGHI